VRGKGRLLHEFSVAQSIVETVIQVAEQHGALAVRDVNLEVGEVALVNTDQLGWHIDMLVRGTLAEGVRLHWTKVSARIRCTACGYEGGVRYEESDPSTHFAVPIFECPQCEGAQTTLTSGRELRVVDISVSFQNDPEGESNA
jgi:hydrogenase nickel incorporation protein HypA/HybF